MLLVVSVDGLRFNLARRQLRPVSRKTRSEKVSVIDDIKLAIVREAGTVKAAAGNQTVVFWTRHDLASVSWPLLNECLDLERLNCKNLIASKVA